MKDYSETIDNFKSIEAVAPFFGSAYGYAVFPTVGKGGLGIGASHGKGQVYRQGKLIGFTSTTDISIGLQAGGQAYAQIIFFQNADSLKEFTSGNFEFAASAEAIAVQAKAEAEASTEGAGASAAGHQKGKKATTVNEYHRGAEVHLQADPIRGQIYFVIRPYGTSRSSSVNQFVTTSIGVEEPRFARRMMNPSPSGRTS